MPANSHYIRTYTRITGLVSTLISDDRVHPNSQAQAFSYKYTHIYIYIVQLYIETGIQYMEWVTRLIKGLFSNPGSKYQTLTKSKL